MTDSVMNELMAKIYEVTHAIDYLNNKFHIKSIHRSIDSEKMLIDICIKYIYFDKINI